MPCCGETCKGQNPMWRMPTQKKRGMTTGAAWNSSRLEGEVLGCLSWTLLRVRFFRGRPRVHGQTFLPRSPGSKRASTLRAEFQGMPWRLAPYSLALRLFRSGSPATKLRDRPEGETKHDRERTPRPQRILSGQNCCRCILQPRTRLSGGRKKQRRCAEPVFRPRGERMVAPEEKSEGAIAN